MAIRLTIGRKGLIVLAIPLFFQVLFVGALVSVLQVSHKDAEKLSKSRAFLTEVSNLTRNFLDLGIALAAYRYTKGQKFINQYDATMAKIPVTFKSLETLSQDSPERIAHIAKLKDYGNDIITLTQSFRRPTDAAIVYLMDPAAYRQKISDGYTRFMAESEAITREENSLQAENPASESHMRTALLSLIALGLMASLLITLFSARFFVKNITRRLSVLTSNNQKFARHEKLNPPVAGADEIAELDSNFHGMVQQIERAEARKRLYVQMLSHDLRAPLSAIKSTLSIAGQGIYGALSEKGTKRFSQAESDCARLLSLINEIIDYDVLEEGTIQLEKEKVQVSALVQSAVNALESLAESRKVKIECRIEDLEIVADRERLARVLINLTHNAIKFSPPGMKIVIETKAYIDRVKFMVKDQGPGVKEEEAAQLFQPFHMGETSKTISEAGSGLGLAICDSIVKAHGGKMAVEANEPNGSCFYFELPIA